MSNCKCSIEMDHSGGPEFFSAKEPVAQVEHKCDECGRKIEPGESYRHESGKWEGLFESYKTCTECCSIRDIFFCSFIFTDVMREFKETAGYNEGKFSPECIAQLTPTAKRIVLDIIKDVRRTAREEMAEE